MHATEQCAVCSHWDISGGGVVGFGLGRNQGGGGVTGRVIP